MVAAFVIYAFALPRVLGGNRRPRTPDNREFPMHSVGILDFTEGLNKGGEDRSKLNSRESGDPP